MPYTSYLVRQRLKLARHDLSGHYYSGNWPSKPVESVKHGNATASALTIDPYDPP